MIFYTSLFIEYILEVNEAKASVGCHHVDQGVQDSFANERRGISHRSALHDSGTRHCPCFYATQRAICHRKIIIACNLCIGILRLRRNQKTRVCLFDMESGFTKRRTVF